MKPNNIEDLRYCIEPLRIATRPDDKNKPLEDNKTLEEGSSNHPEGGSGGCEIFALYLNLVWLICFAICLIITKSYLSFLFLIPIAIFVITVYFRTRNDSLTCN